MLKLLRDYFTLGTLGTVAAVVGIGSGLYSMYNSSRSSGGGGGGGSGGSGAMGYVPQWQGGADQMWQQILRQSGGDFNSMRTALMPFLMNSFASSSAELPGVQERFRQIANEGVDRGHTMFNAGDQLWRTASDPQNALRGRLQHETMDQSRAATSSRGIGMSPQAAGMESEALSNFGMNWEDRQLGRQATGLQGLGMANQAGMSNLTTAGNLNQQVLGMPFNLAGLFGNAFNSGIMGPASGMMGNLGNYMGLGQAGGQQAFGQFQTGMNNLTTGLNQFGASPGWGELQRFWGGSSGGGNPGDPYGNSGSGGSSYVDPNGGYGGG